MNRTTKQPTTILKVGLGLLVLCVALPAGAQFDSLSGWLRMAQNNNREIVAAKSRAHGVGKEVSIDPALPDPSVTGGYFLSPVETRVGPQQGKIGVSQKIPWPGKLLQKKNIARREHDAAREGIREVEAKVFSEVRSAYAEYYAVGREIEITGDNLELLQRMESVLLSQYATGAAAQVSVLKIQVEMAMLEDRLRGLESRAVKLRQSIHVLLGGDFDTDIPFPSELSPLEVPTDTQHLVNQSLETNPELLQAQHEQEAASAGVGLARQSFAPDFTVMSDYVFTGKRSSSMVGASENGKDPWSVGVGVTIPLWAGNKLARISKAQSNESAQKARAEEREDQTRARAVSVIEDYEDAQRTVLLYEKTLLPQARQTISLVEEAYANGEATILDYLDAQRTLLKLEVTLEQQRARMEKVAGTIDMLLGGELSRTVIGE